MRARLLLEATELQPNYSISAKEFRRLLLRQTSLNSDQARAPIYSARNRFLLEEGKTEDFVPWSAPRLGARTDFADTG